jgi:hypothetical protein
MVPKRKRLYDALRAKGYSRVFAEQVAFGDKRKLYEPPKDPVKVLVIMGADNDKAQVHVRESLGVHESVSSSKSRNRRNISVAPADSANALSWYLFAYHQRARP